MPDSPSSLRDFAGAVDFGRTAMTFVDRISSLKTREALFTAFEAAVADFGFDHFIMADLPDVQPDRTPSVMLAKAPIGWMETYIANGYHLVDPVVDHCRAVSQPFGWDEIGEASKRKARALEVMVRGLDFGLADGLTIPIHGFDGTSSCVSLSSSGAPFLNRFTKPALHLMSIYAFEQARLMSGPDRRPTLSLTAREREVLTWAAAGKSAASIAETLKISERTAIAHTINATHKLGASNKTHAVAIALRQKLITI